MTRVERFDEMRSRGEISSVLGEWEARYQAHLDLEGESLDYADMLESYRVFLVGSGRWNETGYRHVVELHRSNPRSSRDAWWEEDWILRAMGEESRSDEN